MKKIFLLPLLSLSLGSLLLGSCSNDADKGINGNDPDKVSRSFLSITLMSPHAVTRADGVYEDGYDYENYVNDIRFYFFDAEGYPVMVSKNVQNNTYLPYIDWTPPVNQENSPKEPDETVEKIMTTIIGITQPVGSEKPSLVLAVLNPPSFIKALSTESSNPTLTELRNTVEDFYTDLYNNNFVITNSVYVDLDENKNDEIIYATHITEDNFGDTEEDEMTPLTIYVERVLARLDFQLSLTNDSRQVTIDNNPVTIYKISDKNVDGGSMDIYINLLGWNIAQTPNKSRLVKEINSLWGDDLFSDNEPWNIAGYHRSFWAINPPASQFDYQQLTFDHVPGSSDEYATQYPVPSNNSKADPIYMQENAADYATLSSGEGPEKPTAVILGARLVDENGETIQLVKWGNKYYTQEGALIDVANSLSLYSKTVTDEGVTYSRIKPTDLKLVAANNMTGLNQDVEEYWVYVQLNEDAKAKTWYNGNTEAAIPYESSNAVNKYILETINYLLVWNEGDTYYYIYIRHLGDEGGPGYYGVVRNHIYRVNLNLINGIGTPVFDPDEVFTPTEPEDDTYSITAQVKILQWRVVSQDYEISF